MQIFFWAWWVFTPNLPGSTFITGMKDHHISSSGCKMFDLLRRVFGKFLPLLSRFPAPLVLQEFAPQ